MEEPSTAKSARFSGYFQRRSQTLPTLRLSATGTLPSAEAGFDNNSHSEVTAKYLPGALDLTTESYFAVLRRCNMMPRSLQYLSTKFDIISSFVSPNAGTNEANNAKPNPEVQTKTKLKDNVSCDTCPSQEINFADVIDGGKSTEDEPALHFVEDLKNGDLIENWQPCLDSADGPESFIILSATSSSEKPNDGLWHSSFSSELSFRSNEAVSDGFQMNHRKYMATTPSQTSLKESDLSRDQNLYQDCDAIGHTVCSTSPCSYGTGEGRSCGACAVVPDDLRPLIRQVYANDNMTVAPETEVDTLLVEQGATLIKSAKRKSKVQTLFKKLKSVRHTKA